MIVLPLVVPSVGVVDSGPADYLLLMDTSKMREIYQANIYMGTGDDNNKKINLAGGTKYSLCRAVGLQVVR